MKPWRLIVSGPGDGPGNMSIDEAMLEALNSGKIDAPTFRLYSWERQWVTIGYFQRYADHAGGGKPVTRRLTGGLAVHHGADISYGFTASKADWPYLYAQEKTYERIHAGLRKGLRLLGVKSEFCEAQEAHSGNGICVQTFYPYDLQVEGGKVLGSCQRRRGSALLQQGSLHVRFDRSGDEVAEAVARGLEAELGIQFERRPLSADETALAEQLKATKYAADGWNRKY